MKHSEPLQVRGRNGILGEIDPAFQPEDAQQAQITLQDGRTILVPSDLLVPLQDGILYLPLFREQLDTPENLDDEQTLMVIPITVEQAEVSKQQVTRGRVRVHKTVHERKETIDEPGFEEKVEVERVAVNRPINAPPPVRYEGDMTIIPVLEEVIVVQKRLMLKEEIRITKQRKEVRNPQTVVLRSEDVQVERIKDDPEKPEAA